ncbi:hypothetical protein HN51_002664 [Arachis hypogaea]
MLRELVQRWANHKIMVTWLCCFFHYLDRYFVVRRSLPPLKEVGLTCFRDRVYKELDGKAEECLNQEKDRVAHYLHSSSEPKLLEKVQHELLSVYANQLLQKEHSGCHALLRDGKAEKTESGLVVQDFDRKVIELRDKYLSYALESFEVFCNKGVAGSSSTELLATFSDDNILKDLGTLLANRLPT